MKKILILAFLLAVFQMPLFSQLNVTLSVSDITATTALAEAEFTDIGEYASRIKFYYREVGAVNYNPPITGVPPSLTGPDDSQIVLEDLTENTDYEFYVQYYYDGEYFDTESETFTTLDYTAAIITTDNATDINTTTATLNGYVEMGSTVPLEDVHFEWGTTTSYGNSTPDNDYSTTTDVNASLSGLTSGETYHFRIVATDVSSGTPETLYGNDKEFTTGAVPVITGFSVSGHATDEFDIAWSFAGTASSYRLDVATDASFTNFVSGFNNLNTGNANTTYNVTGLAAGTVYYCRIRAKLSTGGTTGNSATDNTITICDAPTATAASSIGVSQFTANWQQETGASSYLLDVSLTNTFGTFVGSYENYEVSGGASISQVVSGLSPSTDYYYRLRAKNASGNSDYSNIIGPVTTLDVDEVEWDGSKNRFWNDPENWEYNTLPTATIGAIIPSAPANQPIVTVNSSCKYLTIKASASVIVVPQRTLTVSDGDVTIESNSSSTGEIALVDATSNLTIQNGNAVFQQYIPGNRWVFVSVPMSGVTSNDFYLNHNPEVYLSYYNENGGHPGENEYCEDCWSYIEPTTTGINIKQGYKMWIAGSAQTFEFSASNYNNKVQSITLDCSGSVDDGYGWNLVGNPYPSHLDWKKASIGQLENDGYYAWNGSQFVAFQGDLGINGASQYIPPFQGFFVRTATDNSSISFSNSARNVAPSTLYKEDTVSVPDYIRIRINEITHEELTDELIVRFLENANEAYDKIGDAYKMYGNYEIPQIFTYIEDGTELSINALPPEMKDKAIVPLGIFVAMDGTFQFTATEMESFQHEIPIKVRDLETGDVFDLTENPVFEVELDSGYYLNRFEMLFGENTSIPGQLTLKNDLIRINSDNQYINIAVLGEDVQLPLTVEVFDITGKLINKTLVNKTGTSRIYMQHNVKTCVIRLTGNNINKVQKLIIN